MSFRNNLQHLRATHNMTQEQLAMLLGVSRQSVTKWEAERAYPEMDKLIKLCQIFNCTLDDLVQGDLTARTCTESHLAKHVTPESNGACESAPSTDAASSSQSQEHLHANTNEPPRLPQDVFGYDEHMRSFARAIATGVLAIIAGTALCVPLEGKAPAQFADSDAFLLIALFAGILIGIALIVPAGIKHVQFMKAHPYLEDFYIEEDRIQARRTLCWCLAGGLFFVFCGTVVGSAVIHDEALATCALLLLIACGVWLFIYGGIMYARTNIGEYNKEALKELCESEIVSTYSGEAYEKALAQKKRARLTGSVCGIIMLAATIIALLLLFLPMAATGDPRSIDYTTGPLAFFWLPWPIGGICCGIAALAINAKND